MIPRDFFAKANSKFKTASNQRGVFFLTGDIVKALTVCVVLGIMFFVNASDVFAQILPKRIAHLANGNVVMDIPADTIKSFLIQTISLDSDIVSIDTIIVGVSMNFYKTNKYVLMFGGGLTTVGSSYAYEIELEENDGNIYPLAAGSSGSTAKSMCIAHGCEHCGISTTGGCVCIRGKSENSLCQHIVIGISFEPIGELFDGGSWDYAAFCDFVSSYEPEPAPDYVGKPKRIAHLVKGNNIVMDIPADTIKSFLIQTITPDSNVVSSIDTVIVGVPMNPYETNKYVLMFGGRLTTVGSSYSYEIELEEEDGNIYPLTAGSSGFTVLNICIGKDGCEHCAVPTTGGCVCIRGTNDKKWCQHIRMGESPGLIGDLFSGGSWDYAMFCNLVNNYGGISEPEEKPEPEFELLDSVRLNNIRDLILLDVEKKIRTLRKESFAGAEGFDIKANFANDLLNFNIETETSATATLDIYDISGIKIGTRTFDLSQGTNAYSYSTSAYTSGTYLYSISIDGNLLFDGQFTIVR